MSNNKRIIEVAFPVEEVSQQGRRDRNKRQITGLHIWWASRPLGPSRATAYAALVDSHFTPSTSDKYCEDAHKNVKSAETTISFLNLLSGKMPSNRSGLIRQGKTSWNSMTGSLPKFSIPSVGGVLSL